MEKETVSETKKLGRKRLERLWPQRSGQALEGLLETAKESCPNRCAVLLTGLDHVGTLLNGIATQPDENKQLLSLLVLKLEATLEQLFHCSPGMYHLKDDTEGDVSTLGFVGIMERELGINWYRYELGGQVESVIKATGELLDGMGASEWCQKWKKAIASARDADKWLSISSGSERFKRMVASAKSGVSQLEKVDMELMHRFRAASAEIEDLQKLVKSEFVPSRNMHELYQKSGVMDTMADEEMKVVVEEVNSHETGSLDVQDLLLQHNIVLRDGRFGGVVVPGVWGSKRIVGEVIPWKESRDSLEKERFAFEMKRWKSLDHANITPIVGAVFTAEKLVLVTPRFDVSVYDLLYNRTCEISSQVVEAIMKEVLEGLCFLHSRGILHGSLWPETLLVSRRDCRLRLSCFGLSELDRRQDEVSKWLYRAPELFQEPALWTGRADLYSVGMLWWELVHRNRPWEGLAVREQVKALVLEQALRPPFDDTLRSYQPWYRPLIESCWAQIALDRHAASAVLAAIEKQPREEEGCVVIKKLFEELPVVPCPVDNTLPRVPGVNLPGGERVSDEIAQVPDGFEAMTKAEMKKVVKAIYKKTACEEGLERLLSCIQSNEIVFETDFEEVKKQRSMALTLGAHEAVLTQLKSPTCPSPRVSKCILALAFLLQTEKLEETAEQFRKKDVVSLVMDCMKKNSDPEVQANGAFCLSHMGVACEDDEKELDALAGLIFQAMLDYPKNPRVQFFCFAAIEMLNVDLSKNAAFKEIILNMLDLHLTNTAIQECACRAMSLLSMSLKNGIDRDIAEQLLACMRAHPTNLKIQQFVCAAIGGFARSVTQVDALVDLGALESILHVMEYNTSDLAVQLCGCYLVHLLVSNFLITDHLMLLRRLNAQARLRDAKQTFPTHPEILRYTSRALTVLEEVDPASPDAAGGDDASRSILDAVKMMELDETFEQGLDALFELVKSNYSAVEKDSNEIKKLRLVACNVNAAVIVGRRLEDSKSMRAAIAARCLSTLAFLLQTDRPKSIALELVRRDAARFVMETISVFEDDAAVQASGLFLLFRLLRVSPKMFVQKFGDNKAIENRVTLAMQRHKKSAMVQYYGCATLECLIQTFVPEQFNVLKTDKPKNDPFKGVSKVNRVVLTAIENHSSYAGIVENACQYLNTFANKRKGGPLLLRDKPHKALIMAMKAHPKNAVVQYHACATLAGFDRPLQSVHARLEPQIVLDTLHNLLCAIQNHPDNGALHEAACTALVFVHQYNRLVLVDAESEAYELQLLDVAKSHAQSKDYVIVTVLDALIDICEVPPRLPRILEIVKLLAPDNLPAHEAVCKVLRYRLSMDWARTEPSLRLETGLYVLTTIKNRLENVQLEENGCWVLTHLVEYEESQNALVEAGLIEFITATLSQFISNTRIMEGGTTIIARLAKHDKFLQRLAENDAAARLLFVAKEHPKRVDLVVEAFAPLGKLLGLVTFDTGFEMKSAVCMLAAMKREPLCLDLQQHACDGLAALCVPRDKSEEEPVQWVRLGALDILFGTMRTFCVVANLVKSALIAMEKIFLFRYSERPISDENVQLLKDCVESILDSPVHSKDLAFVRVAASVLAFVCLQTRPDQTMASLLLLQVTRQSQQCPALLPELIQLTTVLLQGIKHPTFSPPAQVTEKESM